MFINVAIPWLAATPDSLVIIDGEDMGCLEVKCPFVCAKKPITAAAMEKTFCLHTNSNGELQLKRSHQYFYQVQTQLFVTRLSWGDFVLWAPGGDIHVERIFYDQAFIEEAISKARVFYFDKFLPSVVPYFIISQAYEHSAIGTDLSTDNLSVKRAPVESYDEVEFLCVSTVSRPQPPINILQQLHCTPHTVCGDGNCLYYSIAHQAGYIEPSSRGDKCVGQQLRMLTLITMQKYPDVRTEEGLSQQQWETKKLRVLQATEWGGDLEICLLAIGIGREIVVITRSGDKCTSARRFLCHPPPVPKMRGGIFIPMDLEDLLDQWNKYNPPPLLIIYNGINHYDSTNSL